MSISRSVMGLVVMGGASAGALLGQATVLEGPEAAFDEGFSVVQTVRELPDGRVLVADPLGQTLVVVDMDAGTMETLGRVGQGPREYSQPDAVWPLPGGKTLLVDLGNGRLTELSPSLEFGETRPYMIGELGPGRELVLALPQGVDAEGRLYFRSFGSPGGGGMMADSAYVLRLDLATESLDSVAAFKIEGRTRQSSGGANNQSVSIQQIPLSPADAWGVAPDGRVVFARVGDYRVEWVGPDGAVTAGPANEYRPVRIGQGEKEEWAEERALSGGGMQLSVTNRNGAMSMSASRGGAPANEDLNQYEWPSEKPPFNQGRISVDREGRAWVRRHVEAGGLPLYDVFGSDGAQVAQFQLEAGRRVVGFGDRGIYVVKSDEFGLQYLERYSTPSM